MPLHLTSPTGDLDDADRTVALEGVITVEDAEPLTTWLRATPAAQVDLRDCTHLHTAALQALLAARVKVSVLPVDAFLRGHLVPVFQRLTHPADLPRSADSRSQEDPA